MISLNTPLVFANLVEQAKELSKTADWEPFRPGVTAHWLYKDERDKELFKLKLGGGITVICMLFSLLLIQIKWVWATAAAASYLHLFFVRYKERPNDNNF